MSSSHPVEGGRGLRLRVFGFPVHVDLSFVVIMGLIGFLSGADSLPLILLWLVVATLAVLLHELGHAVVARTTGAHPAIALTGFGGLTTYAPPRPLTRLRSLAIALAGPLTGLAAAGLLELVWSAREADLEPGSAVWWLLRFAIFTTEWWSLLNLIPVLPLDGGQALRELLPGNPEVRTRRAAMVSLVALVPLVVWAFVAGQPYAAMLLLFFGLSNVQTLRATSPQRPQGPQAPTLTPEQAVAGLLWQGAGEQARQVLESLPPGTPVDLAVHGAVLAVTDQRDQGEALLAQEVARRPGDPNVAALVVLAHTLVQDWNALEADLSGPLAPSVPLTVVERALELATAAGRPDVAGRLAALPRRQAG